MAIPGGTIVADMVTKTMHGRRRNRFYYSWDAPDPDSADKLTVLANGIFNHLGPTMSEVMDDSVTVERCECRYHGTGGEDIETTSTVAGIEGALDAIGEEDADDEEALPDEVSLIIRISTSQGGRSKRGRRFITGLSEQVNSGGTVDDDFRIACIAIAAKVPQDIVVAAVEIPGGDDYGTTLHARHWDRKNNVMMPITKAWAIDTLGTRKDRRKPLTLDVLTA